MHAREVAGVLDRGRPLRGRWVVLFVAPGSGGSAFVASRKVGGAVQRNRARRILRAAWHEVTGVEPQVAGRYDVVLVARQGIRGAKTQDLVADMTELLRAEDARP